MPCTGFAEREFAGEAAPDSGHSSPIGQQKRLPLPNCGAEIQGLRSKTKGAQAALCVKKPLKNSGAGRGTRTLTLLRAADFESAASTDSAIPARARSIAEAAGCWPVRIPGPAIPVLRIRRTAPSSRRRPGSPRPGPARSGRCAPSSRLRRHPARRWHWRPGPCASA